MNIKELKLHSAKAWRFKSICRTLITKSKNDTTHSRRTVFSYLKQKEAVTELFGDITTKVSDRPGDTLELLNLIID